MLNRAKLGQQKAERVDRPRWCDAEHAKPALLRQNPSKAYRNAGFFEMCHLLQPPEFEPTKDFPNFRSTPRRPRLACSSTASSGSSGPDAGGVLGEWRVACASRAAEAFRWQAKDDGNWRVSECLRPLVVPLYPFLGEGSPTKIDYRKKRHPYSNLSTGGPRCALR